MITTKHLIETTTSNMISPQSMELILSGALHCSKGQTFMIESMTCHLAHLIRRDANRRNEVWARSFDDWRSK